MKLSDKGICLLKQLEGCVKYGNKHVVYDDKTGKPVNINKILPRGATIGYGHLINSEEDFRNGITEKQATAILLSDIAIVERAIKNTINVNLLQHQYDALVIFAYNIGIQNFVNSTVVKYVNNPNFKSSKYPTLKSAWMAWNKSGGREITGLTNRRNQEFMLFTNGGIGEY